MSYASREKAIHLQIDNIVGLLYIVKNGGTHDKILSDVSKDIWDCNHGKNISRVFHILAQFPLAKNERELDYYHQNVNVWVASGVAERRKT